MISQVSDSDLALFAKSGYKWVGDSSPVPGWNFIDCFDHDAGQSGAFGRVFSNNNIIE